MRETVTIRALGQRGDGIAKGPLFVPRSLPGEVVSGVREGDTLTDVRIEVPSNDRVAPPCRHFKSCGGCSLQHASDELVAFWKVDLVRSALHAHDIGAEIGAVHTSPAASRRRATLAARRTKKGAMVGFHARQSDVIVEIPDCKLLAPDLMAVIPAVEALAIAGASRKGALAVTVTASDGGIDVAVTNGKPLDRDLEADLAQLSETHDLARLAWDGEVIATRRPPYQIFGPAKVVPPAGAFLQATKDGEAALRAAVLEIVSDAKTVVDLFAGCGTFSLPLAKTAVVHAVEGARDMVDALDQGWRKADGLKQVVAIARDLFRQPLLPDELARFDACVIDPPRAGAEAQIAELAKAGVPVIAHVSCNPVTFARDAKRLIESGYNMGPITVVDQFRWSPHVELVAGFSLTDR